MYYFIFIIGLYPLAESFNLSQAAHLNSLGLDDSLVPGFASHLQTQYLSSMFMSYCFQSQQVTCDSDVARTAVCKISCKYLKDCFYLIKASFYDLV